MSEVKVNKISPRSGTTVTLGDSGDTFTLASGVSLTGVNATFSGDLTVDTNTLYVDSTNNRVGVGTSSPSDVLDVTGTSPIIRLTYDAGPYSRFLSNNVGSLILQADEGNTGSDSIIRFDVDGTERCRIDASGNLLVGKTSFDLGTAGQAFISSGVSFFTRDGDKVLRVNRLTSDGDIIDLLKDGTTVGSIGTAGGDIVVGTGNIGLRFNDAANTIEPWDINNNNGENNIIDLGYSGGRFKDFYLSGNIYLGGTTSANALDDYEEGTFTPGIEGTTTAGTFTPNNSYTRGRYTKIGRMVNVYFALVYSSFTGTGNIRLTGLPFASENTYMQLPASVIAVNMTKPTDSIIHGEINANGTSIRLFTFDTTSSSRPALAVDPAAEIYISVTYHTG